MMVPFKFLLYVAFSQDSQIFQSKVNIYVMFVHATRLAMFVLLSVA